MYFKKVEIFGFKSFADKTILYLEPGITAVVGPNGCGKSNIFDAIRWGLGEQSVKQLRGSVMEDVIFNGTDKKVGLGFAEVSITFSNESRMLPVDYNEVTVTRRLFRSGESEYLINKTVVRLKDIQEMLMGTGIGAEAYSLVQQGKVDLIVSARPEDRRIIIDEASGITKYKSKKREALSKLENTEENLLRLNDIILEVKRQISSLERQASKAKRYKEEFEQLKNFEVKLAKRQMRKLSGEKKQLTDLLTDIQSREDIFVCELRGNNDRVANETELLADFEQQINDVYTQAMKTESEINITLSQINFINERMENLVNEEYKVNEKKGQLQERCQLQRAKIEDLKIMLISHQESFEKSLEVLKEKKNYLTAIVQMINDDKAAVKMKETKILEVTAFQVKLKNSLTEVMKIIQEALAKKSRLELELNKVSSEKENTLTKLHHLCRQIENNCQKLEELGKECVLEESRLKELRVAADLFDQVTKELQKKALLLESQKQFVEELRVQYQDIPTPIIEGRLITRIPPLKELTGIIGKVKEVMEVDPKEYAVLKNNFITHEEPQLYEIVCETKFIELDIESLALKGNAIEEALAKAIEEKNDIEQRIVQQQAVINNFFEKIKLGEKAISIAEAQKVDLTEDVQKVSEELGLAIKEIEEASDTLRIQKVREDELSVDLAVSNQELDTCQNAIKARQENMAVSLNEREQVAIAIAQMETEIHVEKDRQANWQENLKVLTESLDNCLEEIIKMGGEIETIQQKKEEGKKEIENFEQKIGTLRETKKRLEESLTINRSQKEELAQKIKSSRRNIIEGEKRLEEIREQIHREQLKEQEISFVQKSIKDRLVQTYKLSIEELFGKEEHVPSDVIPLGDLTIQDFSSNQVSDSDENLTNEIERLKKRCDAFGAVNLVAIDEFEELKQRYEFMTKQQSDLLTAKESLHSTILKINRTTREMFLETFVRVNAEFRVYYRMLFGGGDAELVLLDPENALESGIEIIARPPGKKLQNISLLSGGEKSLTAIALIFGIFKVRPSPFCVLDEIDAALDESNVERFSYLLKDFAKIAQFIVITHNKKTITHATTLYGITMQETGISAIVSVKLSAHPKENINEELPARIV